MGMAKEQDGPERMAEIMREKVELKLKLENAIHKNIMEEIAFAAEKGVNVIRRGPGQRGSD